DANADPASLLNNFVMLSYPDDHSAQFDVHLHKDFTYSVPVGLGLGGLGLQFDAGGMAEVHFSWDYYFGFVVTVPSLTTNPANDVYLDTQAWKAFNPNADADHAHDFAINVTVTTPGLNVGAQLGVLRINVSD